MCLSSLSSHPYHPTPDTPKALKENPVWFLKFFWLVQTYSREFYCCPTVICCDPPRGSLGARFAFTCVLFYFHLIVIVWKWANMWQSVGSGSCQLSNNVWFVWTNKNMTAGSATCLRQPVKTCHVDQLDHGARGGVLRNVKNERKSLPIP